MSQEAQDGIRQYLEALDHLIGKRLTNGAQSPHRFLLDHGRAFQVTDKTYAGKRDAMKQCYSNAGRRALDPNTKLFYAEGYVTSVGIPIPHAWLVNAKGEVFDPTLRDNDEDHGGRAYYGLAFDRRWMSKALLQSQVWGLLTDLGPGLTAIVKGETHGMLAKLRDPPPQEE